MRIISGINPGLMLCENFILKHPISESVQWCNISLWQCITCLCVDAAMPLPVIYLRVLFIDVCGFSWN